MGLWMVLYFVKLWHINMMQVVGDSLLIVNWENKQCLIQAMHLQSWLDSRTNLLKHFPNISIMHIFSEFNVKAYSLSKRGILVVEGTIS